MNRDELLRRIRNARYNLDNARKELGYAKSALSDSITVNGICFKNDTINSINNSINQQINIINNRIIPKINKM